MGYLTDGFHGKPFRIILHNQGKICCFLYAASVVWYCLLSHDQINSGTYLSENALLPGLVVVEYNSDDLAVRNLRELEMEAVNHTGIPTAWIRGKMLQSGLEVFTQKFSVNHPLRHGIKYSGQNVYGILRGGGASTESIVLSVPYRPPSSNSPPTNPGLALVLSVAHYFRRQKYWAKDIILLVTEHEQVGTQSWLEAYHGVTCGTPGVLEVGELQGRAGSIQAAINVELGPLSTTRAVNVKLAGLNGQLPNLDLYNLIHRISTKERIPHAPSSPEIRWRWDFLSETYVNSFLKMGSLVLTQASGVPDGNHGLYHRFGIEAVTVEGHTGEMGSALTFHQLGRVIEGVFRSINNLLERFHQSYFFYLLADDDKFVSIGYYMVCVGLLAGALFIKSFRVYLMLRTVSIELLYASPVHQNKVYPDVKSVNTGVALMVAFLIGFVFYVAPPYLILLLGFLPTEDAVFYGYLFLSMLVVLLPTASYRLAANVDEWHLLEMVLPVLLATLLIAVAMHNFSLAFVVGVAVVPSFLSLKSSANGLVRRGAVLWCHPLSLVSLAVSCLCWFQYGDFNNTLDGIKHAITLSVVDSHIYASSTVTIATLFYMPVWFLAWILAQA